MSPSADTPSPDLPIYEPEEDATYTLEMTAKITGVATTTILHYHEEGLLSQLKSAGARPLEFDNDTLRQIQRIEHLRETYEAPTRTVKLILGLMDEVEKLRQQLRRR